MHENLIYFGSANIYGDRNQARLEQANNDEQHGGPHNTGIAGGIRGPRHRRAALLRHRSAQKRRHAKNIEGPQHQLHRVMGTP